MSDTLATIIQIATDLFSHPRAAEKNTVTINGSTRIADLTTDSMDRWQFIIDVEEKFGTEIDDQDAPAIDAPLSAWADLVDRLKPRPAGEASPC